MANISSHFNSFLFNNKGGSWNSLQMKNKTATAKYIYSSVTTQTGPLGRRFSNPLISLRFLKTRFSSFFFCKWSNKIQDSTIQPLHWTLWNRLNLPDLSGNNPQIYDSYWSVWKKTRESFALEIVVIGQSSSKCPGSSNCNRYLLFSLLVCHFWRMYKN